MDIKGSEKLVEIYGRWPSFHDSEILRFHLNRDAPPGFTGSLKCFD
jgi:hypothetical protein